jgi:hypothetical protein
MDAGLVRPRTASGTAPAKFRPKITHNTTAPHGMLLARLLLSTSHISDVG